jgi:hypothetical protein
MSDADFTHDVFLSHSSKDTAVVHAVAERLRADGLRVWFDDWEIRPGDDIPAKIEDGLEHSRVLACPAVASGRRRKAGTCGSGQLLFRNPQRDAGAGSLSFDIPNWHFKQTAHEQHTSNSTGPH